MIKGTNIERNEISYPKCFLEIVLFFLDFSYTYTRVEMTLRGGICISMVIKFRIENIKQFPFIEFMCETFCLDMNNIRTNRLLYRIEVFLFVLLIPENVCVEILVDVKDR